MWSCAAPQCYGPCPRRGTISTSASRAAAGQAPIASSVEAGLSRSVSVQSQPDASYAMLVPANLHVHLVLHASCLHGHLDVHALLA